MTEEEEDDDDDDDAEAEGEEKERGEDEGEEEDEENEGEDEGEGEDEEDEGEDEKHSSCILQHSLLTSFRRQRQQIQCCRRCTSYSSFPGPAERSRAQPSRQQASSLAGLGCRKALGLAGSSVRHSSCC